MGMSRNLGLMPYKDPQKQKESQARYFQENKKQLAAAQNKRRNVLRRRIQEIKESTPCTDCGIQYPPYVLDFDHLPQFKKAFNVTMLSDCPSALALEEEIAKCEVVCANCHRHRTFMRKVKT